MGNNATKETRDGRPRTDSPRQPEPAAGLDGLPLPVQGHRPAATSSSRHRHRHEIPVEGDSVAEPRKETRAERDARKAEKERVARAKEREKSLKEESVDGGYLVTLGVYTGPEDFSKPTVRQLMLERRIAPFWRGLDDHSEAWVEHQLVAAARGLPIPAPDEIPLEQMVTNPPASSTSQPIAFRHGSAADIPSKLSASTSFFSRSNNVGTASSAPTGGMSMFRGRSSTLASLGSKNSSQQDLTPQEIQLPHEPQVNGQPVEAFLYKDAAECPICFMYYPPYLNKTRCCDQAICSECFVQIKRPDPHPPEHHGEPGEPPQTEAEKAENEGEWVSEVATCPFCKQPEFGVTYEPPPFRRGLAYANQGRPFVKQSSALSSSISLSPPIEGAGNANRRRATSLSANASTVITTDKIRPDWATKLADARAHQARRAAAATALHNAAYLLGTGESSSSRFGLGRRRRQNLILTDGSNNGSGSGTPRVEGTPIPNMELLLTALEQQTGHTRSELAAGRRPRGNDIEELMMMEAIRQSMASEEERLKKELKATAKDARKEEKAKAKEQKKADKTARKGGGSSSPFYSMSVSPPSSPPESAGKGKARAADSSTTTHLSAAGVVPLTEPSSTLNTELASDSRHDAQRHLEYSRANLDSSTGQSTSQPIHRPVPRHMSDASSLASSFAESPVGSYSNDASSHASPNASGQLLSQEQDDSGSLGNEGMFNFQSLTAMMGKEEMANGTSARHVEDAPQEQSIRSGQSDGTSGAATSAGRQEADMTQAARASEYYQKRFGDVDVREQ